MLYDWLVRREDGVVSNNLRHVQSIRPKGIVAIKITDNFLSVRGCRARLWPSCDPIANSTLPCEQNRGLGLREGYHLCVLFGFRGHWNAWSLYIKISHVGRLALTHYKQGWAKFQPPARLSLPQ